LAIARANFDFFLRFAVMNLFSLHAPVKFPKYNTKERLAPAHCAAHGKGYLRHWR